MATGKQRAELQGTEEDEDDQCGAWSVSLKFIIIITQSPSGQLVDYR